MKINVVVVDDDDDDNNDCDYYNDYDYHDDNADDDYNDNEDDDYDNVKLSTHHIYYLGKSDSHPHSEWPICIVANRPYQFIVFILSQ